MAKDEKKKRKKPEEPLFHPAPKDPDKDPFRWVTIVLFLIVLFVTYIFWSQGK